MRQDREQRIIAQTTVSGSPPPPGGGGDPKLAWYCQMVYLSSLAWANAAALLVIGADVAIGSLAASRADVVD